MSRRVWTMREDQILKGLREKRCLKKWSVIAQTMFSQFGLGLRSGKQCRQRYFNHLDASISSADWSVIEDNQLLRFHEQFGNKWSVIAQQLPGRSQNCVKNHFYSRLRKSMRKLNKTTIAFHISDEENLVKKILPRIIEVSEARFKMELKLSQEYISLCTDLIKRLYNFQFEYGKMANLIEQHQFATALSEDIHRIPQKNTKTKFAKSKHRNINNSKKINLNKRRDNIQDSKMNQNYSIHRRINRKNKRIRQSHSQCQILRIRNISSDEKKSSQKIDIQFMQSPNIQAVQYFQFKNIIKNNANPRRQSSGSENQIFPIKQVPKTFQNFCELDREITVKGMISPFAASLSCQPLGINLFGDMQPESEC